MIYIFENPETGEQKEVFIKNSYNKKVFNYNKENKNRPEEVVYIDEKGLKWNRVFLKPSVSIDTKINDSFSEKDFLNKTRNKNYTLGELWDTAAENSEKRGGNHDPIKKDYVKKRRKRGGLVPENKDKTIKIKDLGKI